MGDSSAADEGRYYFEGPCWLQEITGFKGRVSISGLPRKLVIIGLKDPMLFGKGEYTAHYTSTLNSQPIFSLTSIETPENHNGWQKDEKYPQPKAGDDYFPKFHKSNFYFTGNYAKDPDTGIIFVCKCPDIKGRRYDYINRHPDWVIADIYQFA